MMEVAFDIASGATYKFNTARTGEQVRPSRNDLPELMLGWYIHVLQA